MSSLWRSWLPMLCFWVGWMWFMYVASAHVVYHHMPTPPAGTHDASPPAVQSLRKLATSVTPTTEATDTKATDTKATDTEATDTEVTLTFSTEEARAAIRRAMDQLDQTWNLTTHPKLATPWYAAPFATTLLESTWAHRLLYSDDKTVRILSTGTSISAGHDNLWSQAYPQILRDMMTPAFAAAGLILDVRSIALGNNACQPYDGCVVQWGLNDTEVADLIFWEHHLNCVQWSDDGATTMGMQARHRNPSHAPPHHRPLLVTPFENVRMNAHVKHGGFTLPSGPVDAYAATDANFSFAHLVTDGKCCGGAKWHPGPFGHLLVGQRLAYQLLRHLLAALDLAESGLHLEAWRDAAASYDATWKNLETRMCDTPNSWQAHLFCHRHLTCYTGNQPLWNNANNLQLVPTNKEWPYRIYYTDRGATQHNKDVPNGIRDEKWGWCSELGLPAFKLNLTMLHDGPVAVCMPQFLGSRQCPTCGWLVDPSVSWSWDGVLAPPAHDFNRLCVSWPHITAGPHQLTVHAPATSIQLAHILGRMAPLAPL